MSVTREAFIGGIMNYAQGRASLEVGALDKPLLNPVLFNNKILDFFSQAELRENWKNEPSINKNAILNVDYVVKGVPYTDIVPANHFDMIISSHSIEHQPDLIYYFKNLSSVLKPGGKLFLIIPDHRYCFDAFRRESDIIDVLAAHLSGDKKPTPFSQLDHEFRRAHNYSMRHWNNDHGVPPNHEDSQRLLAHFNEVKNKMHEYVDSHVWKFTPTNFRSIVKVLNEMGLSSDLKVEVVYDTIYGAIEFYAVVTKTT